MMQQIYGFQIWFPELKDVIGTVYSYRTTFYIGSNACLYPFQAWIRRITFSVCQH